MYAYYRKPEHIHSLTHTHTQYKAAKCMYVYYRALYVNLDISVLGHPEIVSNSMYLAHTCINMSTFA